ncbi:MULTISPECIES: hypothetical protein [Sporosarcina]|uniref:hypothetical protein n=1 Tax=Sporosarcina TaxID=1569 RepID=UPI000590CEAA|nr:MULTISPECIES: hypothetical protein [Sporosarcina]WJY27524.1 hypothetical protein QWT68_00435 [Sporosarcina sp. 0.2-SM1T-5]
MKKNLLLLLVASVLGLAACGETSEENVGGTVNSDDSGPEATEPAEDTEQNVEGEDNEINEVIADNENLKATLVKIVKKTHSTWGNSIEVIFDVENKRQDKIEVQARSVSADGRMVDETLLSMSQEVAAGKSAKATLSIEDYEGYKFPELNSDLEMELHVFSWDDMEYEENFPVKVEL